MMLRGTGFYYVSLHIQNILPDRVHQQQNRCRRVRDVEEATGYSYQIRSPHSLLLTCANTPFRTPKSRISAKVILVGRDMTTRRRPQRPPSARAILRE
jgi:hypothetical protein